MNQAAEKFNFISPEDYLEGEKLSDIRHEYINGHVYAMAGESKTHNEIVGNLYMLLRQHLRGSDCRVFIENVKTHVQHLKDKKYFYPDVQVTCESEDNSEYYEDNPKLIIEVLSPSTERRDRSEKFSTYRKIPILLEYVLVAQDIQRVEVYRRSTSWDLEVYGEHLTAPHHLEDEPEQEVNARVYFESLDCYINLDEIYEF